MNLPAKIKQLQKSAAAWSFLAIGLKMGGSLIAMPVIVRVLPPDDLGIWYIFLSIGALANLADLGLGNNLARAAAFFWAGATDFKAFGVEKSEGQGSPNLPKLRSLLASSQWMYRWIAIGAFVLMLSLGFTWITRKLGGAKPIGATVLLAWLFYACGMAINIYGSFYNNILIGTGRVRDAQQAMILGQIGYLAVIIPGLLMGGGLMALALGSAVPMIINRSIVRRMLLNLLSDGTPFVRDMSLVQSLWPNTWRFGLVMMGSYLIYNSNTWLCSNFIGLTPTASYGLSLQLCQVLSGVAGVFLMVKIPTISQLRTQGREREVASLLISRLRLGLLTFMFGGFVLWFAGPKILALVKSKTHLLPPDQLGFMICYLFFEFHHSQHAQVVTTENQVPFAAPAIVSGLAIFAIGLITVRNYGMFGLLATTAVVQASCNNWWPVQLSLRGLHLPFGQYLIAMLNPASKAARNLTVAKPHQA